MNCHMFEMDGISACFAAHCRRYGLKQHSVQYWVKKGYLHAQAILVAYDLRIKRGPSIARMADMAGLEKNTVYSRLKAGWSLDRALSTGPSGIEFEGITATVADHCRRLGINYKSMYKMRHDNNLTTAQALEVMAAKKRRAV